MNTIKNKIDESIHIPPFTDGKTMVIRGTDAWYEREAARERAGYTLYGASAIPARQAFGEPDAWKLQVKDYKGH